MQATYYRSNYEIKQIIMGIQYLPVIDFKYCATLSISHVESSWADLTTPLEENGVGGRVRDGRAMTKTKKKWNE